jgi:hypothetical protein
MIEFYCKNCGQRISAPGSFTGKKCQCPKCKNTVIVPETSSTEPASEPSIPTKPPVSMKYSDYELTLLNVQEQRALKDLTLSQSEDSEQTSDEKKQEEKHEQAEQAQERRFPWFIDIFLYPLSLPGLKHLAIFAGVPTLMVIVTYILPGVLIYLFSFVCLAVNVLLFLYFFWYLAECIRDSADGWVRAPQGMGSLPDLSDMFGQMINIIGCLAFFLIPIIFYILISGRIDVIVWLLLIAAMFFYPISFLSVVLHDSVSSLNPRILLRSIRDTFWPYLGLVLMFILLAGLMRVIYIESELSIFWDFVIWFAMFYASFILAHLTGRFYWRYKEKLKWDFKSQ